MAKSRRSGMGKGIFAKNPDVLPFFSFHPKTRLGTIVRIAFSVFVLLELIVTILASNGIMFLWYVRLNWLIYVVPIVVTVALVAIALYKRMKTTFSRLAVPGLLVLFTFTVVYTMGSMLSYTNGFAMSPQMMIESRGHNFVFFRECVFPEASDTLIVEKEDGTVTEVPQYDVRVDAHLFTVRVPNAVEGEQYEIKGEIRLPSAQSVDYEVKGEWTDEDSLRIFISKDSSGVGEGEITVDFMPGDTMAESPEASESAIYKTAYSSPDGKRDVYLYREDSYLIQKVDTPLMMNERDFEQVFSVYPRSMYIFAKTTVRSEGNITIEPYGTLAGVQLEWLEEDSVARFTPTSDSVGVEGEIIVYLNEKNSDAQASGDDAPATQGEAQSASEN